MEMKQMEMENLVLHNLANCNCGCTNYSAITIKQGIVIMREIFVPHTIMYQERYSVCIVSTELNCGETNLDSAFVLLDTIALLLRPMLTVYEVKYGVH